MSSTDICYFSARGGGRETRTLAAVSLRPNALAVRPLHQLEYPSKNISRFTLNYTAKVFAARGRWSRLSYVILYDIYFKIL